MNSGDIVRVTTLRCLSADGRSWVEFRPDEGKKKVFLALVVGVEPKNVTDSDPAMSDSEIVEAMRSYGWERKIPADKSKRKSKKKLKLPQIPSEKLKPLSEGCY